MFRKLRNNFILTTMSILTIVVVISFAAIYIAVTDAFRPQPVTEPLPMSLRVTRVDEERIRSFIDEQRQDNANRLAISLVLVGVGTLIAGFFISRYLADRAIQPVSEAYEKQKQFIADASHELKTPLAVIDANIEAEISDRRQPSKWLKNIQTETSRMSRLVKDLLVLAKFDAPNGSAVTTFDISEVVTKTLQSIEPLLQEKSLRLSRHIESPVMVTSQMDKMQQIVSILIDNAIKHTAPKGAIEVWVHENGGRSEIIVSNTHKKISQDKLNKVFDRFYQADNSHEAVGYGLGLSIAKAAAAAINADLVVSQANKRVIFTLQISSRPGH